LLHPVTADRQNDRVAERVQVREIVEVEGRRLLRIVRRGTGSVVTWRRAQMVLLSAQGMPVARIAGVAFTSADRVRDVIRNFNTDGFQAPGARWSTGRMSPDATLTIFWWSGRSAQSTVDAARHPLRGRFHS
jgi:hypothetical protein